MLLCLTNLLALHDEIIGSAMKERVVGVEYLDFSKAFDTVSCSVLFAKLVRSGLGK